MAAIVEKLRAPFRSFGVHDGIAQAVFAAGALLRVALVMLGDWMDAKYGRTYTDVDYVVFSEGAREVWEGRSPYDRATYRYTPLLAWLTIPNVWWPSFGKHMFTVVDMTIAGLTFALLRWRGLGERAAAIFSAAFLLHPFAINISTRGNADSLVAALVLATLYFLFAPARGRTSSGGSSSSNGGVPTLGAPLARRVDAAAVCFGLAVHTKIYPFIFALPLLLVLDRHYAPQDFPHYNAAALVQQLAPAASTEASSAPSPAAPSSAVPEPAAVEDLPAADGTASAESTGSASASATTVRRRQRASSSSASARGKKVDKSAKKQADAAEANEVAASSVPTASSAHMAAATSAPVSAAAASAAAAEAKSEAQVAGEGEIDESGSRFSLALGRPVAAVVRTAIEWGVAAPLAAALGFVEDFSGGNAASSGAAAAASSGAPSVASLRARFGPRAHLLAEAAAASSSGGSNGGLVSRALRVALAAVYWAHDFVTARRVGFGLVALGVFAGVTAACYAMYGWTFLWETYLYHLVRTDNRHNFSPYFYDLYLRFDEPPASRRLAGLLSFLPQFGTLAVLGALYHRDLPMALLLQTLVFVAWNKVITVQYFHWYLSLAPLVLPQAGLALAALGRRSVRAAAVAAFLCIAWLLTEVRTRLVVARSYWPCFSASLLRSPLLTSPLLCCMLRVPPPSPPPIPPLPLRGPADLLECACLPPGVAGAERLCAGVGRRSALLRRQYRFHARPYSRPPLCPLHQGWAAGASA